MLKIENLSLSYGEIEVLHGVSLHVDHKEIVAIVGSNGSGKTTLLRSISGLLPVSSGRISFGDVDITHMRADKLVRMGICQIPEGRHIFPALSVYANLEMGAYVRRGRSARVEFEKNIQFIFELFPILEHRKKQKGGTLSGGEQQMLAMARALMAAPKLLMLDEPSMGIAPLVVKNIFRTIRQLNSQGLTVLMVEQEVEASLSISKRGYALQLGRIVLEGTGQELLANEQVKAIYLGTAK
jgi:branched-chain amino acid transport system ATP-binding protein